MPEDPSRTVHAQQGFELAEVFQYKFGHVLFGQARPRRLKLLEPDVSTAGGKRARQSMVLVPEEEGEVGTLVIGWLDAPARAAELRSYNVVRQQFEARFNTGFDMKREEYDSLVDDLRSFLKIQRFDPKIVEEAALPKVQKRSPAAEPPASPKAPAMMAMLSIGILIGFALGYVVFGLL